MKRAFVVSLMLATAVVTFAQTVVSGVVVDKSGRAIPSAQVQVDGSDIVHTTNLDGTFLFQTDVAPSKLIISSYGKKDVKKRYESGMTVKMKPLTWWNESPSRWNVFAGVEGMHLANGCTPLGGRVAVAKQWGFYVHFAMTTVPENIGKATGGIATGGKYKSSSMLFGGGAVVRLASPFYVYAGAGYRKDRIFLEHLVSNYSDVSDGYVEITKSWLKNHSYTHDEWHDTFKAWDGLMCELGFMFNYRMVYFNAGMYTGFKFDNGGTAFHLGAGVKF